MPGADLARREVRSLPLLVALALLWALPAHAEGEGQAELPPTVDDTATTNAPTDVSPPAAEAEPKRFRVLVLDLKRKTDAISPGEVDMLTGLIATELGYYGNLEVMSGSEVRRLLELEGDKQAAGCDADESCLIEVAGALDAQVVISGQVGKLGTRYIINLSTFDAADGKVRKRVTAETENVGVLTDQVRKAARQAVSPYVVDTPDKDIEAAEGITTSDGAAPAGRWVLDFVRNADVMMIPVMYGLGLCGPCAPLLQYGALAFGGDFIAGRQYPLAWIAPLSGGGVFGLSLIPLGVGVVAIVQAFTISADPTSSGSLWWLLGGVGAIVVHAGVVILLEPAVAWLTGRVLAQDVNTVESVMRDEPLDLPPVDRYAEATVRY